MDLTVLFQELMQGFGKTLIIFIVTLALSIPLGLVISFGSRTRFAPVRWPVRAFVWIIRGTPLMLQLLLVSLVPRYVFGVLNKNVAGALGVSMTTLNLIYVLVAFVINYACYFSEIFRGAIDSIPRGQYEAGKVLGLTKSQIFFKIVLFQVIRRVLAPVSNETITLVKDTALASTLSVIELLKTAQQSVNEFVVLSPLLYAGLFYLIFNGLLTILFQRLEKKMAFYKE